MRQGAGRRARPPRLWRLLLGVSLCGCVAVSGQEIQLGDGVTRVAQRQYVSLATDAVRVKAGRPDWVELRFRVETGFHINSHAPHDELLIATAMDVRADPRVTVVGQEYPAGVPLRLDTGAGEVLSTYAGEFRVRLQVVAKGDAVLAGVLRYQACDGRSCFPPRRLPVRVAVAAQQ